METQILKPTEDSINLACKLLQNGEVVAVPTETVYGLAGDSTNPSAIQKIFTAKGRPQDNPLIVHIANMDMLDGIVSKIPDDAKKLAETFWPGPITIIMPKGNKVCDSTCAGLNSVGVRMPSHPIAHEIISRSRIAFAAPSANLSGKPSPTNANDVYTDMIGRIPLIIDGGECDAGVESTVISTLDDTPIILRPGVITKEMIETCLNKKVDIAKGVLEKHVSDKKVLSPGIKYKHYAPKANITILKGTLEEFKKYVDMHTCDNMFVMCFDEEKDAFVLPTITYGSITSPQEQAHRLFRALRELDEMHAETVYARCPETTGISMAVYNRLIRAAGFRIIQL